MRNKYLISFNHEDLIRKNISEVLNECILNLKKEDKVHISMVDARDIRIENLIYLIEFILRARRVITEIHFSFSEELKKLLREANLYKLFVKE